MTTFNANSIRKHFVPRKKSVPYLLSYVDIKLYFNLKTDFPTYSPNYNLYNRIDRYARYLLVVVNL